MKKINYLLYILLVMSFGFIFTSASKGPKKVEIVGVIHSYGNEPMSFLGLETDSGNKYGIINSNKLKSELKDSYSSKIKIKGYIHPKEKGFIGFEELEDGSIEVIEWSVIR